MFEGVIKWFEKYCRNDWMMLKVGLVFVWMGLLLFMSKMVLKIVVDNCFVVSFFGACNCKL